LWHDSTPLQLTGTWARLARLSSASAKIPHLFPVMLAAYGLLHILVRLVISESAELDEAEQLLLSQSLAVGYTDQPPLYTWLLILFEAIFGVDILSLALLKNLLLFITHLCLFLAARIVLNDAYLALLTSLSLWLVPQIAWESHRDLTHSVLVTSVSSGFFYVMIKLLHSGRTRHYLLLGLLLALGVLSKHGFLLFAAALCGAVLSQRKMRDRLLDRRMLLACALAGVLILPYFLWFLEHFHPDTSPMTRKLELHSGMQPLAAIAMGLFKLIRASVRFLTPFWLICLLIFPQLVPWRSAGMTAPNRYRRMLERFFLMVFGILAAAVILFGVTRFKDRWMQPLLFLAPLYVFVRLREVGVAPARLHLFASVLAFFGLVCLVALLAQAWVAPWFGMFSRLHTPFEEIAQQLRAAGFKQGTIVAENTFIAGNLRLAFVSSRVMTPEITPDTQGVPRDLGQCLVVWDGNDRQPLPVPLQRFLTEALHAQFPGSQAPHYAEAWLRRSRQHVFRVGFLLFPDGLQWCN
jgi:lipopolysaccharide core galacturonosyltransferase RgtB